MKVSSLVAGPVVTVIGVSAGLEGYLKKEMNLILLQICLMHSLYFLSHNSYRKIIFHKSLFPFIFSSK